jgi:hypothetical protein
MIHTDEDDEFERIAHEAKIKGQPYYFDPSNNVISADKNDPRFTPLGQVWPIPAKQEWVGLTDKEQSFIYDQVKQIVDSKPFWVRFADAIEAKLKEKNR